VDAIPEALAKWTEGSDLEVALEKFGGDIVQAVQALKESRPDPTEELKQKLVDLILSLKRCRKYCAEAQLTYPFARSARQVRDVFSFLFSEPLPSSCSEDDVSSSIQVDLSKKGIIEQTALGPYQVPRLFNGFWQLSSPAWGAGTSEKQKAALVHLIESGLVAADMADHYVNPTKS
jgi:hypothetical protein